MTKKENNSIIVDKPGVKISFDAELVCSMNKTTFEKTYKKALKNWCGVVYDELSQFRKPQRTKSKRKAKATKAKVEEKTESND